MNELIKVEVNNNNLVVSSLEIATNFEKRHDHVLRDIENLKDVPNFGEMFIKDRYLDSYGRKQKQFLLNRDGFSLLAMGFTGEKALSWKLKYISAFNAMEAELNSPERIMTRALQIADNTIKSLTQENTIQKQLIGELKPKADYTDRILKSKSLVTTTQIAKDYGMSATKLNKILHELEVQYKQSGQWLLYSKYHSKGYTHSETIEFVNSKGLTQTSMHTKWTQKGRLFLYDLLKDEGIYPTIER